MFIKGENIYKNIPEKQKANPYIITAFIDFYGQCSEIEKTENIYKNMKILPILVVKSNRQISQQQ